MTIQPLHSRGVRAAVVLLIAVGFGGLASQASQAAGATRDGAPARALADAGGLSLDAAIDLVQRRYRAKVIRADVAGEGDSRVYVLRLLSSDGRVWTVRVDAATGSISE